jgi:hypothetical protein
MNYVGNNRLHGHYCQLLQAGAAAVLDAPLRDDPAPALTLMQPATIDGREADIASGLSSDTEN